MAGCFFKDFETEVEKLEVATRFFQELEALSGGMESDMHIENPVKTSTGVAIGTLMAAQCVKDYIRTFKFVQGVNQAIKKARSKFPGQTIRIIYAGTGPFATLALPSMFEFSGEDVKWTLLEINEETFQTLKHTIQSLGLEDRVERFVRCNAVQFKPDDSTFFHILLSETMQHALVREQQVSITSHLSRFLHPEGFFLPQEVKVEVALFNPAKRFKQLQGQNVEKDLPSYSNIKGTALAWNRQMADAVSRGDSFPVFPFSFEKGNADYTQLILQTTIHIFENHFLYPWESGLTTPLILDQWNNSKNKELKSYCIQYQVSENPGFNFTKK